MNKKKILVVFLLVSFIGLGVLWGVVGFDGLKLISADKQKETGAPKEEYSQILCSCQFKEQVDPLDHYPLKKGNKWIYSNVYKHAVGKDQHIVTVTWDKEIEVTDVFEVPEGKVILRKVTNQNVKYEYDLALPGKDFLEFKLWGESGSNWGTDNTTDHYLVQGNYIYIFMDWHWDTEKQALRMSYLEKLKSVTPILFFPMDKVRAWAEYDREQDTLSAHYLWLQGKGKAPCGRFFWRVEGFVTVDVPWGKIKGAAEIVYRSNGGPSYVWFKEGVGIVKEKFIHGGSYFESEQILKEFVSGVEM